MPSANKTTNIGLNQWQGNEYPKRQDLVDDNAIIDTEIGNLKKIAHGAVADLASLKAIDTSSLPDNITIIVKTLGFYRFDSISTATADDNAIVQPTTGSGRWINDLASHKAENATITTIGHVQLQTTVDTSETKALTPKALNDHLLDLITDTDGVHGLKIETGTFTPTIAGTTTAGVHTYAYQQGTYYKIGNLVHCDIRVGLSAKDVSMAGNVLIKNLPFVFKNVSAKYPAVSIGTYNNITLNSSHTQLGGYGMNNTSNINMVSCGTNIGGGSLVVSGIADNSLIVLSLEYEV